MYITENLMSFLLGAACMRFAQMYFAETQNVHINWNRASLACFLYTSCVFLGGFDPLNLLSFFLLGMAAADLLSVHGRDLGTNLRDLLDRSTDVICINFTRVTNSRGQTLYERKTRNEVKNSSPEVAQKVVASLGEKEVEMIDTGMTRIADVESEATPKRTGVAVQRNCHFSHPVQASG